YMDQFSLPEALVAGTLFRWLYDPYENPYRE
ncbi:spore coat associated protein CotJA, partial [Anoxybacillus sp. LAT_38]|nr:spore coat associated protein CotJA [Anoxybacillus sp. LAT_38]